MFKYHMTLQGRGAQTVKLQSYGRGDYDQIVIELLQYLKSLIHSSTLFMEYWGVGWLKMSFGEGVQNCSKNRHIFELP